VRKVVCWVAFVVLVAAVPAVAAPLEQGRMERSWTVVVWEWVVGVLGGVAGEDPLPELVVPPEPGHGGGNADSGPELDPDG
jgi:hypothetical protein